MSNSARNDKEEGKYYWAIKPFVSFTTFIDDADSVIRLCVKGIYQISKQVPLVEAHRRWQLACLAMNDIDPEEVKTEEDIERAREEAAIAERQIQDGFHLLYAHMIVAIWGAWESTIQNAVVNWLAHHPDNLKNTFFEKVRMPLAAYEEMSKEERLVHAVEQVTQLQKADMKTGTGKFESILETVGLNGPVSDKTRRDLYEMSQVRNLVVHKMSLVDSKFKRACPWIEASVGERICVDANHYYRYITAIMDYQLEIYNRMSAALGAGLFHETRRTKAAKAEQPPHSTTGSPLHVRADDDHLDV